MSSFAQYRALRGVAGLAVVVAAAVPACSLVVPLGGISGGAPPSDDAGSTIDSTTPVVEAGDDGAANDSASAGDAAPGTDAGGSDASTHDAGPHDASTSGEASSDARTDDAPSDAPPSEVSTLGYCAGLSPAPLFCDDFDMGALAAPWDQVLMTGGTATLDTTYSVSAPDAMLASVLAGTAASGVDVAAYKSFPSDQGVAGTYTLSFDVRVDAQDETAASDAVLGAIQLWNGATTWDLELEVAYSANGGDFTASLTENSATDYATHAASQPLPRAAWTHVDLGITLPANATGDAAATMSFGGTQVVSTTVKVTTSSPIPEILVGPTYATPATGGWEIRYDDVTFQ